MSTASQQTIVMHAVCQNLYISWRFWQFWPFVELRMNHELPVSHALLLIKLMFKPCVSVWMFNKRTWFWELPRHLCSSESFCFPCALRVHLSTKWHFKRCQKVNRITDRYESHEKPSVIWDCHQFSQPLMLISLLLFCFSFFLFAWWQRDVLCVRGITRWLGAYCLLAIWVLC